MACFIIGGPLSKNGQNHSTSVHRAVFKLGAKKLFVLCLLVKNSISDVYSAGRINFKRSAQKNCLGHKLIGGDISSDKADNFEHFGFSSFPLLATI